MFLFLFLNNLYTILFFKENGPGETFKTFLSLSAFFWFRDFVSKQEMPCISLLSFSFFKEKVI